MKGDKVKEQYADSDIDLFVYGVNEDEANERVSFDGPFRKNIDH